MADDIATFNADLDAFLSPRVVHEHLAAHYLEPIVTVVISSAKSGIGPGGKRYPPYSESYRKQLGLSGGVSPRRNAMKGGSGNKVFLYSFEGDQHMLDPERFTIEVEAAGDAWFTWTASNERMGTYAHVHNDGLPIGRGGPVKQREFMHFENKGNEAALGKAYEQTMDALSAQFSAGRKPK